MGFSSNLVDYQTEEASAIGQQAKTIDGRLVVQRFFSESIFVMAQGGYSYKNNPVPNAKLISPNKAFNAAIIFDSELS